MSRKFWIALCLSLPATLTGVAFTQTSPPPPSPKITAQQLAPATAPSKVMMVSNTEPGERMIITGRVTDGVRPIKNASVFVYHTDAEGYYANHRTDNGDQARLHGAMRTDAEGRYEYRTIRPGSYANSTFPAHVHYVVHADGYRDTFTEFNFEDDPFVNDEVRKWNVAHNRAILKMVKDDKGVWHGDFDVALTRND